RRAPMSALDYFRQTVALLRSLFESLAGRPDTATDPRSRVADRAPGESASSVTEDGLTGSLARWLPYGELASLAALVEATRALQSFLGPIFGGQESLVIRFLEALGTSARSQIESRAENDPEVRRLWTIIDLTLATLLGMVRFGILTDRRG